MHKLFISGALALSLIALPQVVITPAPGGGGTTIINNNVTNVTNTTGSFLQSGGQVVWITGLQFRVSSATYYIQNTVHNSTEQTITLNAADSSNPRIDVIALDDTGTVVKVTGTAASSPSEPSIDPGTQLELVLVQIAANATTPANITNTTVYLEDAGGPTEWNWTSSGTGWTLNSTTNPRTGTKDIEGTNVAAGAYAQGEIPSGTFAANSASFFIMYIRSKAAWTNKRGLQVGLYSAGVLVGQKVIINKSGTWGFDSSTTATYQQVAIPISNFAIPASATITQVRIEDFGGAIGFYLDDISFQGTQIVTNPVLSIPIVGSGNPQGVVVASTGQEYIDSVTGYKYRKLAGSNTNTGWYYVCPPVGAGQSIGPICSYVAYGGNGTPIGIGIFGNGMSNSNLAGPDTDLSGTIWAHINSNGSVGTNGQILTGIAPQLFAHDFDINAVVRTDTSVTAMRFWFGISTDAQPTNSDTAVNNSALFRFHQGTDTGWTPLSKNTSQTTLTTMGTVAVSTVYNLRIRFVKALDTFYFSVNDGAEVTKTNNIPSTSVQCAAILQSTDADGGGGGSLFFKGMGIVYGN